MGEIIIDTGDNRPGPVAKHIILRKLQPKSKAPWILAPLPSSRLVRPALATCGKSGCARFWVGILVLSPLIIALLGAHAQGGARSLRDLLQAPVGHRQSTLQKVQDIQENSSADQAMKKIDEDLKKKLQGICRGC